MLSYLFLFNMVSKIVQYLVIVCILAQVNTLKFTSLDITYQKGLDAYTKERWSECIVQFEESIVLYRLYRSILINCRIKCHNENQVSIVQENIEDLKTYEKYFKKRQCLINCKQQEFENIHIYSNVSDAIVYNMKTRKPYEYLHLCYFQMYALPKAASASYTFLMVNPDDAAMKKNLDYYIQQPEVDIKDVVDLESQDYQILYRLGLKTYNVKNWGDTIANMEESLMDYLAWEDRCRFECEEQSEQEWSPETTVTISNYMTAVLTCKQGCQEQLKPLYNSGIEFLADLLNYLQISYYNLDRSDDVGKAVATYLALLPDDEDMLENKKMYLTLIDEKAFVERSEVILYMKRDKYEKQLLHLFHEENSDRSETNTVS